MARIKISEKIRARGKGSTKKLQTCVRIRDLTALGLRVQPTRPPRHITLMAHEHQRNVPIGGDTYNEKTLGLQWNIKNDILGFNLGLRNTSTEILKTFLPPPKRQATSAVMSIFNPLGLAWPALITAKSMF
ncbi:hypothetical protein EVAR_92237_1 [Eumeta japonica]|uniref:Uncharacterized protein n=1 Tax=Eumeta variegata TaxID=151549 RepID=A0A4C1TMF7_EUMVA|nr:hypothetical protein EVAR_92237_1 [Eumeta japonica]